jgi:membrane-bound ClpP family serine protease
VNPLAISSVVSACVFGGALLGMLLHNWLPVALSVSGAIFLILELDTPFAGILQISDISPAAISRVTT